MTRSSFRGTAHNSRGCGWRRNWKVWAYGQGHVLWDTPWTWSHCGVTLLSQSSSTACTTCPLQSIFSCTLFLFGSRRAPWWRGWETASCCPVSMAAVNRRLSRLVWEGHKQWWVLVGSTTCSPQGFAAKHAGSTSLPITPSGCACCPQDLGTSSLPLSAKPSCMSWDGQGSLRMTWQTRSWRCST